MAFSSTFITVPFSCQDLQSRRKRKFTKYDQLKLLQLSMGSHVCVFRRFFIKYSLCGLLFAPVYCHYSLTVGNLACGIASKVKTL